eukprot:1158773-Pelagomonas_calceolata.AAC.9
MLSASRKHCASSPPAADEKTCQGRISGRFKRTINKTHGLKTAQTPQSMLRVACVGVYRALHKTKGCVCHEQVCLWHCRNILAVAGVKTCPTNKEVRAQLRLCMESCHRRGAVSA